MKKLLHAIVICIVLLSCEKSDEAYELPVDNTTVNQKIAAIVPTQYLDTLSRLGLSTNPGNTPPNLEGTYFINPHTLESSNVPGDRPGYQLLDARVTFSKQNNKNHSIRLIGESLISTRDTSIETTISGSGNKFTVYGKVKSSRGPFYVITAIILTGEKDGNNIKNFRLGIINIDDSKGGELFIREGQGRVGFDRDMISERL